MPKLEKGDTQSDHLHFGYKLYGIYHDHSSGGYPDVVATRSFMYQGCFNITKWTRDIILPNTDRILPKVNQIIYTLETTCMLNIMILAQVVIQILWSQGSLWVKCLSLKRGIIYSNIHRIAKVGQGT